MINRKFILGIIVLAIGVAGILAIWRSTSPATNDKLRVTASFYTVGEFARQVGRDHVTVEVLTKPGIEPHDFDPSPRDVARVHDSRVFVYNGAGLEHWADKLAGELSGSGTIVVAASNGLPLRSLTEDGETAPDPHLWLDPVLAARQVEAIRDAFIQADPANRTDYQANAATFQAELAALDKSYRGLTGCPRSQVVTTHQVLGYVAARYGLSSISIAGLSPDAEPSPQKMAEVAAFVKSRSISHILTEPLVSPKFAETLARETGAKTLVYNPLEGLTPEEVGAGENYVSVQRQNIENLKRALECK
jgi:zinc transport system substrate-binding protein